MPRKSRALSRASWDFHPGPDALEHRVVPSTVSFALPSKGSAPKEVVAAVVPSTNISQPASAIDVTLTRSVGSRQVSFKSPLTVTVSAISLSPASRRGGKPRESAQIAPFDESLTFQAGESTATVVIPISAEAPMAALVPVQITVAPHSHPHDDAQIVVNLASGPQVVPPTITGVRIVRSGSVGRGIAVTFSHPMAPATVEDIHNYAVRSVPPAQLDLVSLGATSLLEPSPYTISAPHPVPLRAARYNAATNTVILVPKAPLTPAKSYTVRSAPSLGSRRSGPRIARPLTDLEGNVLNPLNDPAGSFSITISPKQPYAAPQ